MQRYTVLVTDIDGTLLDSHGRLPAANVEALRRWADQGMTLALATGRNLTITRPIAEAIDRELFLILQDGCLLLHYPSLEILQYHNLSASLAQAVYDLCRQECLSVMLFDPLPHGQSFTLREHGPFSAGLAAYLGGKSGLYHQQAEHGPIGALEASKRRTLQQLVAHLGRDLAEVIAVGDAENDIEMLQAAGLGVAMGNASERVKAAASLIIGSNGEDGLARFLEGL